VSLSSCQHWSVLTADIERKRDGGQTRVRACEVPGDLQSALLAGGVLNP
jgi:hypothetical protein